MLSPLETPGLTNVQNLVGMERGDAQIVASTADAETQPRHMQQFEIIVART